ncbi:MAG: PQQ-binding-like beta-propeller repeat protein [Candidatus Aenigmarchaeota archaeon]|nr:PQQ-binding-like beta-propeller repeat protein [Candidatus Aenigmarchaeota archaeon]
MNANLNDGFSGFELELEDFEVKKRESLLTRATSVGPGGSIFCLPKIVDSAVYFGSMDRYVYAVECETGKLVWKYKAEGQLACNSAESDGKTIYIGAMSGSLYALEAKTGKLVWRFKAGGGVTTKPLFHDGRVYFSSLDGNLYCLNAEGREMWRFKTGDYVYCGPSAYDGKIYFGSGDCNFYCITPDGKEVWRFRAGDEIINELPVLLYKGVVYFGCMDNNLYALDAGSGKELWRFRTGKYGICCVPSVQDNVIYINSRDGILYAISMKGKELWRFNAGALVAVGITCHKDRVYFGSENGNIYCLNNEGKEIWRFKTGGPVWSPPAVWKDRLYDGSWDCHLYCIDLDGKEIWRFASSDRGISKIDPPYKIFEMVVKKSFEETHEKDDKYEINLGAKSEDRFYTVKSEYMGESTYSSKKDYGQ